VPRRHRRDPREYEAASGVAADPGFEERGSHCSWLHSLAARAARFAAASSLGLC